MEKELKFLKNVVDAPQRPFAAVIGGAKVSTKIPVLKSLVQKCDTIIIGGAMMFTFYEALGIKTGKSLVEPKFIPEVKKFLDEAGARGVKVVLPSDVVVGSAATADAETAVVSCDKIPAEWIGLDIGPQSVETFRSELLRCNTVVWNGPMGMFEVDKFAAGTLGVAKILADVTLRGGVTVVGGGDSVAAVNAAHLSDKMSHISTGGGASLELLEGLPLPGIECLDDVK